MCGRETSGLLGVAAIIEHCLTGLLDGLVEGRGDAVEGAEAESAAEKALATPGAGRRNGDGAGQVVFVVVDVED